MNAVFTRVGLTSVLFLLACDGGPDPGSGEQGSSGAQEVGDDDSEPGDGTTGGDASGDDSSGAGGEGETGGDPSGGDSSGGDPGPMGEPEPITPTWQLRDADGEPVPAVVSPFCSHEDAPVGACGPEMIGEPPAANCVLVNFYDGRVWNVAFELESGSALRCHRTIDSHAFIGVHIGDGCTGPLHSSVRGTGGLVVDGDRLLYAPGPEVPFDILSRREDDGSCASFSTSGTFHELVPVPEEVYTLLPNAPYTLALGA